ncbi:hypothetical protein [Streptomyces sp. TP-A0356]|uniref:hypothetical protein n=1 Tax=Streptomyces sp. TP-A0356 TaxID=1359208 RepID=UPI0006E38116|nr:hypothetical protein [Streptomyces sp. TP-A0356]
MTDRKRGPYGDDSDYVEDMTEETLGAQEQARQERQHLQEQQQRGRRADDESIYPEQEDDDYL